jgi:hypothetical protein
MLTFVAGLGMQRNLGRSIELSILIGGHDCQVTGTRYYITHRIYNQARL